MKRKAIALAVGALFVAPAAYGQTTFGNEKTGTVQLYGKLYPQFGYYRSSGATQGGEGVATLVGGTGGTLAPGAVANHDGRFSVDSQNSYVGFRGERRVAGDWKAIFQVEQSIALDIGDATWSNRNSFAGMGHARFGTVKLGNMDTIYKEYGDTMGMFGVSSGNFISASNVLSHIGIGSNNLARFHERRTNSIQYQTGEFGGFQAGVQYGPDEAQAAGSNFAASLWSYGVKYDTERFYVSLHQERKNDHFGASANIPVVAFRNNTDPTASSKDTATRLSAEFRFLGSQRIVLDIARLLYKESGTVAGTKFREYDKVNWAIGWDGGFGPWRFATQYVRAGEGDCTLTGGVACSTDGLEASLWTIGARYRFDRQTFLYTIVGLLKQDPSAQHDNWQNGTPPRGSDNTQAAVGISYTF
jgi:predicted porin